MCSSPRQDFVSSSLVRAKNDVALVIRVVVRRTKRFDIGND